MENTVKTARIIYEQSYKYSKSSINRILSSEEPDSRRYYCELLTAIEREYGSSGECGLIEYFLKSSSSFFSFDVVTAAVIFTLINNETFINNEKGNLSVICTEEKIGKTIPFISEHICWDSVQLGQVFVSVPREKVVIIKNLGQVYHRVWLEIEAAKTEAERIRKDAINKGREIEETARREASRIRDEAQLEKERLIEEGRHQQEAIIESGRQAAQQQFQEELNVARAEAREKAERLVREYITEEQERIRRECNLKAARLSGEERNDISAAEEIHKEMCDRTNQLQANLVRELDSMKEHLDVMKRGLYDHLRKWQGSLNPREYKPLARRYQELYRALNVQGLITEVIMQTEAAGELPEKNESMEEFPKADLQSAQTGELQESPEKAQTLPAEGTEGTPDNPEEGREVEQAVESTNVPVIVHHPAATATSETVHRPAAAVASETEARRLRDLIGRLQKLQTRLESFQRRFEKALNGLDMYVFFPEPGEVYDEYFHVCEDEEPEDPNPVIDRCIVPGINIRTGENMEDVVVRALVSIRPREEKQ